MGKDEYGFENYIIKCFVLYCNITTTFMKMQVKFFKSFGGRLGRVFAKAGKLCAGGPKMRLPPQPNVSHKAASPSHTIPPAGN